MSNLTRYKNLWECVVDHLHYKGTKRLPNAYFVKAYLLGDGFGELSLREAESQDFDWSHVRDSSDKAIEKIHSYITNLYAEGKIIF